MEFSNSHSISLVYGYFLPHISQKHNTLLYLDIPFHWSKWLIVEVLTTGLPPRASGCLCSICYQIGYKWISSKTWSCHLCSPTTPGTNLSRKQKLFFFFLICVPKSFHLLPSVSVIRSTFFDYIRSLLVSQPMWMGPNIVTELITNVTSIILRAGRVISQYNSCVLPSPKYSYAFLHL